MNSAVYSCAGLNGPQSGDFVVPPGGSRELAAEHRIPKFKVGYFYSEVGRDYLKRRMAARRVELEDPNRFGLLGKGSVLMVTSYPDRTSPVLRGAWIMDNLIGTPPTAPPPGVETLMESAPGAPALTVRERMELHRQQQSCNACHGIIDPLGFALENFDVVGAWRDRDRDAGTLIDAHGALPDGQELNGPVQLRAVLTRNPQQFVQTLTEKLMVFGLGRGLQYYDMPAVRQIVRDSEIAGYRFSSIVKGIAASRAFQNERLIEDPEPEVLRDVTVVAGRSPGE